MPRDFGVDQRPEVHALLNPEDYDDELADDPYSARDFATGMMSSDYATRTLDDDDGGTPPEPPVHPDEEELPDVHAPLARTPAPQPRQRPLSTCERALAQVIVRASADTPCTLKPLPEAHAQRGTVAILVLKRDGRKELYR